MFYKMISFNNDPTPLLAVTNLTCCPCYVGVDVSLNETHDMSIAVL